MSINSHVKKTQTLTLVQLRLLGYVWIVSIWLAFKVAELESLRLKGWGSKENVLNFSIVVDDTAVLG